MHARLQLYLLSFELILLIKLCTWFHSLSYKLQEEALQRVDATGGVFDLLHGGQSPRSPACSDHGWAALFAILVDSAPMAPANSAVALLALVRLLQARPIRLALFRLATAAGSRHAALWTQLTTVRSSTHDCTMCRTETGAETATDRCCHETKLRLQTANSDNVLSWAATTPTT